MSIMVAETSAFGSSRLLLLEISSTFSRPSDDDEEEEEETMVQQEYYTPLLADLHSFPLPPDVPTRSIKRMSAKETALEDLKAEEAGEELLLLCSKKEWRLSATPSLPSVGSWEVDWALREEADDEVSDAEAEVEEKVERPTSPQVHELVGLSTPRIPRRSSLTETSADELEDHLDLSTPLEQSAMKHGIISPNSTLLSPRLRRPRISSRRSSSSAALRTGTALTSGLGWSGSEDEQDMEEIAAIRAVSLRTPGSTPMPTPKRIRSPRRISSTCPTPTPTFISTPGPSLAERRGPPPGLSLKITSSFQAPRRRPSSQRLSTISLTSSSTASSMLATPPPGISDPWGDFEIIRDPWLDHPEETEASRTPSFSDLRAVATAKASSEVQEVQTPSTPTKSLNDEPLSPPLTPSRSNQPRASLFGASKGGSTRQAWAAMLE